MEYRATLIVLCRGGSQTAYYSTVEEAKAVLERFATQLAKIKEFSNRDEDPIFRFEGAGALYAVDLRHAISASVELNEQWDSVITSVSLDKMEGRRAMKGLVEDRGLRTEMDEMESFHKRRAA